MSDDKMKFELRSPIPVEGREVKVLEMRRPKAKDFKAIEGVQGDHSRNIALMARLADVPPSSIDELDGADYLRINDAAKNFTA